MEYNSVKLNESVVICHSEPGTTLRLWSGTDLISGCQVHGTLLDGRQVSVHLLMGPGQR